MKYLACLKTARETLVLERTAVQARPRQENPLLTTATLVLYHV